MPLLSSRLAGPEPPAGPGAMFFFNRDELIELASAQRAQYAAAHPFPHIVLDDFLPTDLLQRVIDEFPGRERDSWWRFDSAQERKLASRDPGFMGETTRQLLAELNSATFLDFLTELTGIAGLVPDPHLEGGGLHQIVPGGHLDIHVDFNRHPVTGLDRRLNALIYLNPGWEPEWGGGLELWSADMSRCEQRILPQLGRFVVFSTTERSYHGHPHPLACPEDRTRRSLALYYYSNGRPEERGARAGTHNTLWAQPGQDPGAGSRERAKALVRQWAPPIVLDAVRSARQRSR